MDFTYDEEQVALRDAVRALVGKAYSDFEQRRRTVAEEPGFDEAVWARLAEMGVLALPVAKAGLPEQRAEVLGALGSGEYLLAFAHDEPEGRWTSRAAAVSATEEGGTWRLNGTKEPVLHGARADQLVVSAARADGSTGLFL